MKKSFLSFIALVILTVLSVCALSIVASAEGTPSVSVDKFNLVFEDNTYLKYGVRFDGVDDEKINSSDIGMLYFTEPQGDYTVGGEAYSSSVVGYKIIDDQKYYTFEYRHINAKQMTDYIYSVAYIDLDGERYYSAPVKYSVLEYCYSKLGITGEASDSASFKKLLSATLEQGAAAQEFFGYRTDRLANAQYYQVNVVGGTLEDGFTSGLYQATETAILTAPETSGDLSFASWQNSIGAPVSSDNPANLTGFTQNDTYTATYEETVKYSEGLAFTSNGDGTCYVSGIGTCTDEYLTIPSISPEGETVIAIEARAFSGCSHLTNISIPDSVTNIGWWTFEDCTSLEEVIIPDSVTDIGIYAFENCSALTSIYISQSVKVIPGAAFINCVSLTEVNIPDGVAVIDASAFRGCTSLRSVILPDSVTDIGETAFYGCSSLESIIIPISVNIISANAFIGCSNLTIYCEATSKSKGWDVDWNIEDRPVVWGYGVHIHIGGEAHIENITAATCENTGSYDSVVYCTDCREELRRDTVTLDIIEHNYANGICTMCGIAKVSEGLAYTVSSDGTYYTVSGIGDCTDADIIIPEEYNGLPVKAIAQSAFSRCYDIASVTLPQKINFIGSDAFYYCESLEYFSVDENNDCFKSVDGNLYSKNGEILIQYAIGKTDLSFYVPDGVKSVAYRAFSHCKNISEVIMSNSVTMIGNDAFYSCSNLENVKLGESLESIGTCVFDSCYKLLSITIPHSVTKIGAMAFVWTNNLTTVIFENTSGWKSNGVDISCEELADSSVAAKYLKNSYSTFTWTRS